MSDKELEEQFNKHVARSKTIFTILVAVGLGVVFAYFYAVATIMNAVGAFLGSVP
jgi:hypothetical protein